MKQYPNNSCYRTFLKTASKAGIKRARKYKMHSLTKLQRANRLKWCKKHQTIDFSNWLFSDESYFECTKNGAQFVLRTKRECIRFLVQEKAVSIHITLINNF